MKKTIIILSAILLAATQVTFAIPAKKGKFVKVQPDGTTITLQRHGDEFYHWTTDESGNVMTMDADGYYRNGSMPDPSNVRLGGRQAADLAAEAIRVKRAAAAKIATRASGVSYYNFPVILVQFSDQEFSMEDPQTAFSNLLNQVGYSENGATGSVHDYYWENSMETFYATFDVYGPVTLSGTVSDYGSEVTYALGSDYKGDRAAKAVYEACVALNSSIDFSKYDNDNDGEVDMVFMYYAGYNEAEGADDSTIWPHKWSFSAYDYYQKTSYSSYNFDGKTIDVYACTSELKGTSGTNMCGIGTCAHEFSHTQGLPDFYDTNYSTDGSAGATYSYDIMCNGSYNNEGRTPPYFSAEERVMMGWLSGLTTMPTSGNVTIPSVNNNVAYKLATSNTTGSGEYFIFECRGGTGWDAYVEPGLIVYHADKSKTYSFSAGSYSNLTGYNVWNSYTQYINANGEHPCYYIIPAADPTNLNYGGSEDNLPFPGQAGIKYYSPEDWAGSSYDLFSEISFDSNAQTVTLTRETNYPGVFGYIRNSSGEVIEGAVISIFSSAASTSANSIQKISGRIVENLKMSTTTGTDGYYYFDLSGLSGSSYDMEVIAKDYVTAFETYEVEKTVVARDFTMRGISEPKDYSLKKYDLSGGALYKVGYGSTSTTMGSICFTSDELAKYAGRKILKLAFAYSSGASGAANSVYGIIDFGDSRKLTMEVSSPVAGAWNVIDVSGEDLYIPTGTDCYFGYGLANCTYGYPLLYSTYNVQDGGLNYCITTDTSIPSTSSWTELTGYGNLLVHVLLDDSSAIDCNYIYNPGYGTNTVGDSFALTLVEAEGNRKPGTEIKWYFDDEPVSGESITLKYAGQHVVEARFTTTEGKTAIVELEITVNL